MKKIRFTNPLTKLAAGATAYLMAANAYAVQDFTTMSSQVGSQIYSASELISTISYVAGAGFGMAGILKLKAHSENPGQTPISHGVGRLAAAGGLVTLPWIINNAAGTLGSGSYAPGTGITGSANRL